MFTNGDYNVNGGTTVLPSINPFEFEEEVFSGSDVLLTCHVRRGDQPLTIWWTLNGARLTTNATTSVTMFNTKTSVLTLTGVDHYSNGEYRCIAENSAGLTSHSANLTVYGKNTAIVKRHWNHQYPLRVS